MAKLRFARIALMCVRYVDGNPQGPKLKWEPWPFWFDVLLNDDDYIKRDINGYYFGGHKISCTHPLSDCTMYPVRLDPHSKGNNVLHFYEPGTKNNPFEGEFKLFDKPVEVGAEFLMIDSSKGESTYVVTEVLYPCESD